ncbi:YoaK family protein [Sphingomonas aurea]|uniref:YoaK family protein n=1 Tax=Sphingomonas aurea TaxID=3063994 RepID=UPI00351D23BF
MAGYGRRHWLLAVLLAMLAGYVDAVGFLTVGGFFVSFMSGNSTRMAVSIGTGGGEAWTPAALIGSFVAGVVVAALLAMRAGARRKSVVLTLVAALLALAGAARAPMVVAMLLAAAMGAENGVFQQQGEVSIGVTYMTGTLVKLGQRIAAALAGGPRWAWVPFLGLWLGLMAGAVLGALSFPAAWGLWAASGAAALLALLARWVVPLPAQDRPDGNRGLSRI